MRLLDRIAQLRTPLLVARGSEVLRLPGPSDYAQAVADCPLRLVLSDSLTQLCTSLAYSDGDRLADCLDLIHVPATRLWVEWPDEPRREAVAAGIGQPPGAGGSDAAIRAGSYLCADSSGRRGWLRTFWAGTDEASEVCLAPLITRFDLDAPVRHAGSLAAVFAGGSAQLRIDNRALDGLLGCVQFSFDEAWAGYYRDACASPAEQERVLRSSLASVGTDLPVLLALFLLMSSKLQLPERRVDLGRLNRRRARDGRPPLLEHIEVSAPLFPAESHTPLPAGDGRRPPRLHHVRGHLVRRFEHVYWRVPHLRGHAACGQVRSRSVTLHFDRHDGASRRAGVAGAARAAAAQGFAPLSPGVSP